MVALPRQDDNWTYTPTGNGLTQQIQAAPWPEPVIHQVGSEAVIAHGVQTRLISGHPIQDKAGRLNFRDKRANDDIVILVIFNQQNVYQVLLYIYLTLLVELRYRCWDYQKGVPNPTCHAIRREYM